MNILLEKNDYTLNYNLYICIYIKNHINEELRLNDNVRVIYSIIGLSPLNSILLLANF